MVHRVVLLDILALGVLVSLSADVQPHVYVLLKLVDESTKDFLNCIMADFRPFFPGL